jgi:hypothetical protein
LREINAQTRVDGDLKKKELPAEGERLTGISVSRSTISRALGKMREERSEAG